MTVTTRKIALGAAGMVLLCVAFYYVPLSAAHSVEIFVLHPFGDWRISSPVGLTGYFAAILAGLFAIYAAIARMLSRLGSEPLGARAAVYVGAAGAVLVLMSLPSLLSKDIYDYMVQGRLLAIYRANPFQVPPDAFPVDDFIRAMGWPQFTTLYGPGWVSTCGLLAWFAPGSLPEALLLYKAVFGVTHLLCGLLLGSLLKGWGKPRLVGEMLYLWNPLVLLEVAGNGHNDGFLMFWVLLGLWLAQRRVPVRGLVDDALSAICLTVSVLIKYVTAPILPLLIAVRARERRGGAGPGRALLLALLAVAVFMVGYMPYVSGMDVLHFLRPYERGTYQGSSLMILDAAVKMVFPADARGAYPDTVGDVMQAASALLMLALAVTGLVLVFKVRREEDVPRYALVVFLLYLLVVTALLRSSYGVWLIPLAVLADPGPARRTAFVCSASFFALELFWVYAIRMAPTGLSIYREKIIATLVAVGVPIAYLLANRVRRGFSRRAS